MDSLGYVASLHATMLDSRGSRPILVKPVRKQTRRVSNASISDKAKNFVNRRRNIFSASSTTLATTASRTSTSSSSRSVQTSLGRTSSTLTSPGSSRLPSEERARPGAKSPLPSPASHSFVEPSIKPSILVRIESRFEAAHVDTAWISDFVDNGYWFAGDALDDGMGWDSCSSVIAPSRPKSMIERDWVFSTRKKSLCPPQSGQLLFERNEDQLVLSFDHDPHQTRLPHRPYFHRPHLLPRFTQLPQARGFTA